MSRSFLSETWRAQQIGFDALPAIDPVTHEPLTTPEVVHVFQRRLTTAFERLHGPIQFPTEKDIATLVSHEDPITQSKLTQIISHIRFGNGTIDQLPASLQEPVQKFLRGQILKTAEHAPQILEASFDPYFGKPLHGVEARARLAQSFDLLHKLPESVRPFVAEYPNCTPDQRDQLLDALYAQHGGMRAQYNQSHTNYFVTADTEYNKKHRNGINPNPLLNHIDALAAQNDRAGVYHALANGGTNIIGCEYKLHIQAAPKMHPILVDRLLSAMTHNPILKENIIGFKVRTQIEPGMPDIIIYPRRGVTPAQASQIAQQVSAELERHIADFDAPDYIDGVPRFNQPVSHILFYAQSSGDLKEQLQRLTLLDDFFDARTNHATLRPEFQT